MNLENLGQVLEGEQKYRFKQINEAIFKQFINKWSEAKSLPKALQEKLSQGCSLDIEAKKFVSKDGTIKILITLEDGLKIETVLMRHRDGRNTVCVSTQVGCPVGCVFCATGKMGFRRNLKPGEIVKQVIFFARYLKNETPEGEKISNVVFMGMGEPFLNYDNVLSAIKILHDPEKFNLGARHFSISTVGIIEGIKKFTKEKLEVNLAISLHAPNDDLRTKLIPLNKKYPLKKILEATDLYTAKTNRQVMFEYLLLNNINDSEEQARELIELMKQNYLYHVNLIHYSPTGEFTTSTPEKIKQFKDILKKSGVSVSERFRFGTDIKAACGQLATKN